MSHPHLAVRRKTKRSLGNTALAAQVVVDCRESLKEPKATEHSADTRRLGSITTQTLVGARSDYVPDERSSWRTVLSNRMSPGSGGVAAARGTQSLRKPNDFA